MVNAEMIINATTQNFEAEVMEASFQTPVLVDFWAPWCGPCRMLMPLLDKIVGSYNGALRLAKVNTDEEGEIAGSFGIRSLPTVVLIKDGKPIDGFMGAQPEGAIRAFLAKHMPIEQAQEPEVLDAVGEQEDLSEAVAKARDDLAADSKSEPAQAILADLLIRSGEVAEAQQLLNGLSESGRESSEAARALTRLNFAQVAQEAASESVLLGALATNPQDLKARYQLGAQMLHGGRAEAALEQFLAILKADRGFEDDLGRRALIDAFKVIDDDALVGEFRRRMSTLLF